MHECVGAQTDRQTDRHTHTHTHTLFHAVDTQCALLGKAYIVGRSYREPHHLFYGLKPFKYKPALHYIKHAFEVVTLSC